MVCLSLRSVVPAIFATIDNAVVELSSRPSRSMESVAGERYTFTIEEGANGTDGRISVNYDGFIDDVSVGAPPKQIKYRLQSCCHAGAEWAHRLRFCDMILDSICASEQLKQHVLVNRTAPACQSDSCHPS